MDAGIASIYVTVGGLIGAVITLLLKNRHESKTYLRNERKDFIKQCRDYVSKEDFDPYEFAQTSLYLRLRPFLSEKLKKDIEPESGVVKLSSPFGPIINPYKAEIAETLFKLEKKWGLF